MASIDLPMFLGMQPRIAARHLDDQKAVYAMNAHLMDGYLRGRLGDAPLTDVPLSARKVVRLRSADDLIETYLSFSSPNVDVVRAPLVNDQYQRYYWAGEGVVPSYNTLDRIAAGNPAYKLGITPPDLPLTLSEDSHTGDIDEDRAYTYTWVDAFGHESAPAPPANIATFAIANIDITLPTAPPRSPAIERIRIYRTIPGISSAAFFYVMEVPAGVAPGPVRDGELSTSVARNEILPSTPWFPPPDDLGGLAVMPNGFLVGFRDRDVMFSEPFRPHAWPTQYTLSVEDEIVGIGVFHSNVAILTTGTPYVASGVSPDSMSLTRVGPVNACLSRRSIVTMAGAVLYASEEGLTAIDGSGQSLPTQGLVDRETWRRVYSPESIVAAREGDATYLGFFSPTVGFAYDFAEPDRGLTFVDFGGERVDGIDSDLEGRRSLLTSEGKVYVFSSSDRPPMTYEWTSKEFFVAKPVNFGAGQINTEEPFIPEGDFTFTPSLTFTLIADGREVYSGEVRLNEPFKLPATYKAQVFQCRVEGNLPVSRITVAETERELGTL